MEPKHIAAIAAAIAAVILVLAVAVYVLGGLSAPETLYSRYPHKLLKFGLKNDNGTLVNYKIPKMDSAFSGVVAIIAAGVLGGAGAFVALAPSML